MDVFRALPVILLCPPSLPPAPAGLTHADVVLTAVAPDVVWHLKPVREDTRMGSWWLPHPPSACDPSVGRAADTPLGRSLEPLWLPHFPVSQLLPSADRDLAGWVVSLSLSVCLSLSAIGLSFMCLAPDPTPPPRGADTLPSSGNGL